MSWNYMEELHNLVAGRGRRVISDEQQWYEAEGAIDCAFRKTYTVRLTVWERDGPHPGLCPNQYTMAGTNQSRKNGKPLDSFMSLLFG